MHNKRAFDSVRLGSRARRTKWRARKKNSVKIKQQKQRTAQQIEHTTLQRKSVQSAHYIHRV